MKFVESLLSYWGEPVTPIARRKTYEEIYGERVKQQIEELRAAGRYLPEMEKPHWNKRTM